MLRYTRFENALKSELMRTTKFEFLLYNASILRYVRLRLFEIGVLTHLGIKKTASTAIKANACPFVIHPITIIHIVVADAPAHILTPERLLSTYSRIQ